MKLVLSVFVMAMFYTGCASRPDIITEQEVDNNFTRAYSCSHDDLILSIKESVKELEWEFIDEKKVNQDKMLPKIDGKTAQKMSYLGAMFAVYPPEEVKRTIILGLRSPMVFFTKGVKVYVNTFMYKNKATLRASAFTEYGNYALTDSMPKYLNTLIAKISSQVLMNSFENEHQNLLI